MEVVRSYYEEVVLGHTQSAFNEYLEIAVSEGKLVLNSRNANYSYGNLQKVFEEALFQLQIRRRNVNSCLVLGLGAGSVVKSLRDKFRIKAPVDGVELDPEVIRLGKEWFGLGEIDGLSVFNMDANEFLEKNAKKYDLILVDIFFDTQVPSNVSSRAFIDACVHHLEKDGLLLMNTMLEEEETRSWDLPSLVEIKWLTIQERNRLLAIQLRADHQNK